MESTETLILRFIGEFARAQSLMEDAIQHRIQRAMPSLGPLVNDRLRLNDAERLQMLHALAKEVDFSGDLSGFDAVFKEAKAIRDRIAHSGAVQLGDGNEYMLLPTPNESKRRAKGQPVEATPPLTRSGALRMLVRARWLVEQAMSVSAAEGSIQIRIYDGSAWVPHQEPVPDAEPPLP